MTINKKTKTLESLSGIGHVCKGGQRVAKVRYELQTTQSVHVFQSINGAINEVPGLKDGSGRLWVIDAGSIWPLDEEMALLLEDGRSALILISDFQLSSRGGLYKFVLNDLLG